MDDRKATVQRKTKETDIRVELNLDGAGESRVDTGIGFFDHMLDGFARHGLFDLEVTCKGDLQVDAHHTVEDVGIVLGEAIRRAVGEKQGIKRYGFFLLPMDETLIACAVDLSGRPCFVTDVTYTVPKIGEMDAEMIADFFRSVSYAAGINLHVKQMSGTNNHHLAEASFKAFAKALDAATSPEPRMPGIWSTKGAL